MPTVADEPGSALHLHPVGDTANGGVRVSGARPATVGRAEECEVPLADPSVSRRHARLEQRDGRWFLTDLGSRHGTFLNSIRLQSSCPAIIEPGDLVRLGGQRFRLECAGAPASGPAATCLGAEPGTIVERVEPRAYESWAQRRLELLIDGAAAIQQAADEEALARAVVELALAGSVYRRAAVLGGGATPDAVQVLASRDLDRPDAEPFTFSRSLLAEAASGHIARLARMPERAPSQSIVHLHITSAVCAPILLDDSVAAFIYLDSRGDEQPGQGDALGFCHAVARLAGLALANQKRLELQQRQRRLEGDIQAARQAQAFLLPPGHGTVGHLRYALQSDPGRVVAGDLFDIAPIDAARVAVCCGDVTGQGMGAGILMTAVLAHLRAALERDGDPARATELVNRYLVERSPAHMYLSLWVGVFDAEASVLRYVDGGHGHWLLWRAGDREPTPAPRPRDLLVGIKPDHCFQTSTIEMSPGDRLVLYTDGVVEHRDGAGEEFGCQRLIEAIARSASVDDDVATALTALHAFTGHESLEDDTTLASIQVTGAAPGS